MRVIQAEPFGGPEVLVASEAPDPVAGPGQVVVEVSAAEVLFLDTQLRSGWGRELLPVGAAGRARHRRGRDRDRALTGGGRAGGSRGPA